MNLFNYHREMAPIDFEKYKFKLRSLPNYKTFPRYFSSAMWFIAALAMYNFVYICLGADDFMPVLPAVFIIAIPIIFLNTYNSYEKEFQNVSTETLKEIIIHIRLKQYQSLKERIEENPEVLNQKYKDKSLLYWAKHHQNVQAHSLIIHELKKANELKKSA